MLWSSACFNFWPLILAKEFYWSNHNLRRRSEMDSLYFYRQTNFGYNIFQNSGSFKLLVCILFLWIMPLLKHHKNSKKSPCSENPAFWPHNFQADSKYDASLVSRLALADILAWHVWFVLLSICISLDAPDTETDTTPVRLSSSMSVVGWMDPRKKQVHCIFKLGSGPGRDHSHSSGEVAPGSSTKHGWFPTAAILSWVCLGHTCGFGSLILSNVVSKLYTSATSTGKKWQDDSLLWYLCVPLFSKIDTQKCME